MSFLSSSPSASNDIAENSVKREYSCWPFPLQVHPDDTCEAVPTEHGGCSTEKTAVLGCAHARAPAQDIQVPSISIGGELCKYILYKCTQVNRQYYVDVCNE